MMNAVMHFALPLLSSIVAILYWRRASVGLERHVKKVAVGFSILALYELIGLSTMFRTTSTVWLFKIVAAFGILNIMQYIVLLIASLILASWTWYYLLKRLSTQLFMLSLTGAVGLSLLITGLFVTLLLKSVETESLVKLTSNARVTASLIDEKKARLASETKLFAQDSVVKESVISGERKDLIPKANTQMSTTGISSLVVTDSEGKIILKGENEEERGVSWSDDKYVQRALKGESSAGIVSIPGVMAPELSIRVAVPVGRGSVVASQVLDNAFVDGLKATTGLAVSIYGDQLMSSTTEDVGDGKTRLTGIKETNKKVIEAVWKNGETIAIAGRIGDREYLSAYVPLRDQNNEITGVMQVSQPQVAALQTAGDAVQMTFALVIVVMLVLSMPIYFVCEKIVREWE